jgi:hypothetical protein
MKELEEKSFRILSVFYVRAKFGAKIHIEKFWLQIESKILVNFVNYNYDSLVRCNRFVLLHCAFTVRSSTTVVYRRRTTKTQ